MRTMGLGTGWIVLAAAIAAGLLEPRSVVGQDANAQAAPVAAESLERTFTFIGNELRITIAGPGAGTLRVVRGQLGRIEVVARSYGGIPVAALGSDVDGQLVLDSGPAARADYIVTIPRETRLGVRLAGHPGATLSPLDQTASWSWPAHATEPAQKLP